MGTTLEKMTLGLFNDLNVSIAKGNFQLQPTRLNGGKRKEELMCSFLML